MAGRQLPGGRHGLSPEHVADHQRQRTMDAVVQLAATEGARALVVERVIATAGISRKTFYDHFTNREDAVVATYRLVAGQLVAAIGAAAHGSPGDPVGAGLAAALTLIAERPDVARFLLAEAPLTGPGVRAPREQLVTDLMDWLRRAGGQGDVRLRAAAGGLLEALAHDPGDGAELARFLRDAVETA